jgi:YggT family protein
VGSVVSGIATIVYFALLLYFFALWARFLVDLVQALSERWRPRGAVLVIAEVSFTVTDPAIKAVRRVIPPWRVGGFSLDFGFTIVMFGVLVLMYLATALQAA